MGVKRRAFLIGGAALVGGGVFALKWADNRAITRGIDLIAKEGESAFGVWFKIADDDTITVYSPHVEMGQGAHTSLAQMLVDELDGDWSRVIIKQAPADPSFANAPIGAAMLSGALKPPKAVLAALGPALSFAGRNQMFQPTWGSMTVAMTGQFGMRVVGAAARKALLETAADRLGVPMAELSAAKSVITHAKSGRTLGYGELAQEAAKRPLDGTPTLKSREQFSLMGKNVNRLDIPAKVDGSLIYASDFVLPDMRIATIMAAPVRGGKLTSLDPAPALAISGVEKVVKLENAVIVVANRFWTALKGLRALTPVFTDAGHSAISSALIRNNHLSLLANNKASGSDQSQSGQTGATTLAPHTHDATYHVPFLHHAPLEPYVLSAFLKDGKLDVWGGLQDPLGARAAIANASGLPLDKVAFHPQDMGGAFGRRNVSQAQVIEQVVALAMQVPYPVKLIWTREEDVQQGCYRPQSSARLIGTLDGNGMVSAIANTYVENFSVNDTGHRYNIKDVSMAHLEYQSNQVFGVWRGVNYTQHGFYMECFMDELAALAREDPYQFRRKHLTAGSRERKVLDAVATHSNWSRPLPAGVGRGIAIVSGHGTVVAQVVEASLPESGIPKVQKVYCVVDCGTTVSPLNAKGQVQGGIIMGLSAAIHEAITLDKGRVQQSNFGDYRLLSLAETPDIDVHFIESDGAIGGLGEPCLPPTAPALANALFASTGTRFRQLPLARSI